MSKSLYQSNFCDNAAMRNYLT